MALVWELDLPPGEKLVLLALADQANDEGRQCWPSVETIAHRSGQGIRTVRRALASLEDAGHLTRNHRDGTSSQYHVHPGQNGSPAKSAPLPKTTKTPAKLAPKPSRTTSNGLSDDKPMRAFRRKDWPKLPDWLPAEPWNGFVEMRRRNGNMPTPRAVELMVGKLERWKAQGHDPGAILDASTENNWRGLFEPKGQQNGRLPQQNPNGSIRGSRPDPALDMFLQAQRDLADEAQREGSGFGIEAWSALPPH